MSTAIAATGAVSGLAPVIVPLAVGLVAGLVSWFFEFQLRDFIEGSPWLIPVLIAIGASGLTFWLMLA